MTDSEIEILSNYRAAHDEIVMLRRAVAELKPKATALDILERALFGMPPSQGYGEDIAWRLKKEIERMAAEREAAQTESRHE